MQINNVKLLIRKGEVKGMSLVYIGLLILMCAASLAIIMFSCSYFLKVNDELVWREQYEQLRKAIKESGLKLGQKNTSSEEEVLNEVNSK